MEHVRRSISHRQTIKAVDAAPENDEDIPSRNVEGMKMTKLRRRLTQVKQENVQTPLTRALPERLIERTREKQSQRVQYRKRSDLKLAFSEFYLMLVLLQNYQTLNFTGFRKILKKHDKLFQTTRGEEWR